MLTAQVAVFLTSEFVNRNNTLTIDTLLFQSIVTLKLVIAANQICNGQQLQFERNFHNILRYKSNPLGVGETCLVDPTR